MAKDKEEQGGGNTYINMTGGIFIKNIQHVEHLHAVPEKKGKENITIKGPVTINGNAKIDTVVEKQIMKE